MEAITQFNVRVYALLFHDEKLMILKEPYAGEILYKLPGGGVEFGEGIIETLQREFREELNLELENYTHFYTQEEFLVSRFRPHEQLITIYYIVEVENISHLQLLDPNIEEIIWIPKKDLNTEAVNLPIDKKVIGLYLSSELK